MDTSFPYKDLTGQPLESINQWMCRLRAIHTREHWDYSCQICQSLEKAWWV